MRLGVFELRYDTWPDRYGNDARDAAIGRIEETLEACTFPWHRCIPALRRINRLPFPIEFMDPLDGANGYVSRNRMWLRPGEGLPTFQTIAHELAHVADLATLGEGLWQDGPVFNATRSPWRLDLLKTAEHRDDHGPDEWDHNWQTNQFQNWPWESRPVENITVPFAKAFFDDPKFHYTGYWLTQIEQRGHVWADVDEVRDVFLSRSIAVFTDVDPDSTHADGIHWAAGQGLVEGFDDGTFRPDAPVTRGQLATILHRLHRGADDR